MYDKTVFKPTEIDTLGKYQFSLVEPEETSGQSDGSSSTTEDGQTSSSDAAPPSQFDLGDFSDMKPAKDSADDAGEDELPLLGGPDADK